MSNQATVIEQQKGQEVAAVQGAKKHALTQSQNAKALLYAYLVFTESVIVSSKETALMVKQEQKGASQASKLKDIMDKFQEQLVTRTNGGVSINYVGTITTNQGLNPTHHHFTVKTKPTLNHGDNITHWVIGGKWYNTQSVSGHWQWNNYKTVRNNLSVPAMYLTQIDIQNEFIDQNRDFFRGKISGIQQGNQLIVGNLSSVANAVSQETNEGMNLIQILEKISVKISQAFISQNKY